MRHMNDQTHDRSLIAALEPILEASSPGIFLDFDGTLAEIAPKPDDAKMLPEAASLLRSLASKVFVAVVSGRTPEQLAGLVVVPGVHLMPRYGSVPAIPRGLRSTIETTEIVDPETVEEILRVTGGRLGTTGARAPEQLLIEHKGESVAVHARGSSHPDRRLDEVRPDLERIADEAGMEILEGKQVLELVPQWRPRKGTALIRETVARDLDAALFVGDDLPDLEAFQSLEELRDQGIATLSVAVRSVETPTELIREADFAVDGPVGVVRLLQVLDGFYAAA